MFSMQVYWSSLFILPKKVIKEIEALLRAFFWFGADLKKSGAKVAWSHLSLPRNEGGLGFKAVGIWNKAAVSKHVWVLLASGEQSMWCQWVKSYLLEDRCFWNVKVPGDSSWVRMKMLGLRGELIHHIRSKVDHWHPLGPLHRKFGDRVIYDSGIQAQAKVYCQWPYVELAKLSDLGVR